MKELLRLKNKIKYPRADKKKVRYRYFTGKLYQQIEDNNLV